MYSNVLAGDYSIRKRTMVDYNATYVEAGLSNSLMTKAMEQSRR